MPSFDAVNYSLRPSKTIQRAVVFEGIRRLREGLALYDQAYIGFGSVWFTDFIAAHRLLGIDDMVSIEANAVGYARAKFNAPYASVEVRHGLSSEVLPILHGEERFARRPWIVWLDYDSQFTEAVANDLRWAVEKAPPNSILITTFNARDDRYGHANDRADYLRSMFGGIVPDDLSKNAVKADRMAQTLASLSMDLMRSVAAESSRPGSFIPAFKVIYTDTAPMVTVGGILPAPGQSAAAKTIVSSQGWLGSLDRPINAPHLTVKEASSLQTLLPRVEAITRAVVRDLGFDLEDHQIEAFQAHYRQYPSFAQVVY